MRRSIQRTSILIRFDFRVIIIGMTVLLPLLLLLLITDNVRSKHMTTTNNPNPNPTSSSSSRYHDPRRQTSIYCNDIIDDDTTNKNDTSIGNVVDQPQHEVAKLVQVQRTYYDWYSWEMVGGGSNNNITTTTTSFPINISTSCYIPRFVPFTVMFPPADNLLCSTPNIPNRTLERYSNQMFSQESVVLILPLSDLSDTNCTLDTILSNTDDISLHSYQMSNILIPTSYITTIKNQSTTTTTTSNGTTSGNNNNTTLGRTSTDICSNSFIGSIVIDDNAATGIEKAMIEYWEQSNGVSSYPQYSASVEKTWQYTMMVLMDFNCDGEINWDDYEYYNGIHPTGGYSDDYTTNDTGQQKRNYMWMLSFLVVLLFLVCWYSAYKNRRDEIQAMDARLRQPASSNNTPAVSATTASATTTTRTEKLILTKDDFDLLPQFTYHIPTKKKKSSRRLTRILLPALRKAPEDNDEVAIITPPATTAPTTTTTSSPSKLDVVPEDDKPIDHDEEVTESTIEAIEKNDPEQNDDTIIDATTTAALQQQLSEQGFISTDEIIKDGVQKILSSRTIWNESSRSFMRSDCCCICLDEFQENEILTALPRCIHFFHTPCIEEWLLVRKSDSCPLCKSTILDNTMTTTTPPPATTTETAEI